mmetsp:Transcript_17928/g.30496  ORF Transcript_17928/g.30496 Transcript_17928/m.30496 type:complete len:199 (-) Transcript_17928:1289-1885(-)
MDGLQAKEDMSSSGDKRNAAPMFATCIFDQVLCDIQDFLKEEDGTIDYYKLKGVLNKKGIMNDDPRITGLFAKFELLDDPSRISKQEFIDSIRDHVSILETLLFKDLVIKDMPLFRKNVLEIFDVCKQLTSGKLADYIPELANQDPSSFAVSICTVSGQRLNIGNFQENFTVQRLANALNFCIALEEFGMGVVKKFVG